MPSQNTRCITCEDHDADDDSHCGQHVDIEEDVHDHLQELAVVLLCDDELVNVLLPVINTVEMKVKGILRNRMNQLVQE